MVETKLFGKENKLRSKLDEKERKRMKELIENKNERETSLAKITHSAGNNQPEVEVGNRFMVTVVLWWL